MTEKMQLEKSNPTAGRRVYTAIMIAMVFWIFAVIGRLQIIQAHAAISYPSQTEDFYVADYAGLLSNENEQIIIDENRALREATGAQICVLTVDDLEGDSIENYANETFRKWKIGDAKKNNGVLILVSKGDRKDRIEVGYGLEGDLTDAESADILKHGNAFLKDNDWESGIMTIYTEVAEKVHQTYDIEYTPKYVQADVSRAGGDAGADADVADGDEEASDSEEDEDDPIGDFLGHWWVQIPVILLFILVYIVRILGDHGLFIRILQWTFSILFVLSLILLIIADGNFSEVSIFITCVGLLYMPIAGFNALVGAFFDGGIGSGGGSSDWGSSGGGTWGGGGSSGGGGASGSF